MKETRGKGPFAKRGKRYPPDYEAPRWSAPRIALDKENILEFLKFIRRKNDKGLDKFFTNLATMRPEHRLARNLNSLIQRSAVSPVSDVLSDGLSDIEVNCLIKLEGWGINIELLGVAHALLDINDRQRVVMSILGDLFLESHHKNTGFVDASTLDNLLEGN